MNGTRSRIPSSAYKVVIFAVVTLFLIGVLATLIGNISFVPSRTYQAQFTDAIGVLPGDRVRLSGVEVGSIRGVKLVEVDGRRVAQVTFSVDDGVPIFRDAHLTLRYENIVGQRYLAITEAADSGSQMPAGGTFPLTQTTPALDLTTLFNGFQPLFQALSPNDLNAFSYQLIQVLQGESGSIAGLMRETASVTSTLADRDQVIGQVVDNLNAVLGTVGGRDDQLTSLIVQFSNLMHGLTGQRDLVDAALPSLASLLGQTSQLVSQARAPLTADIGALSSIATRVAGDRAVLNTSLKGLPNLLKTYIRTASYGSWYNFYLCGLSVQLTLPGGTIDLAGAGVASDERDTVCAGATP